jgi:hypothetical protein
MAGKISEREQITMLAPIHVENPVQFLGTNGTFCAYFGPPENVNPGPASTKRTPD